MSWVRASHHACRWSARVDGLHHVRTDARSRTLRAFEAVASATCKAPATRTAHQRRARHSRHTSALVGIEESRGALACFTDDDAIWTHHLLKHLLAPFNDDRMGGTGSNQVMRPSGRATRPTPFERIANMRLSERMFEGAASTFYDGSVSCLSGRTALYHKRVLEPREAFEEAFCNEYWGQCAPPPPYPHRRTHCLLCADAPLVLAPGLAFPAQAVAARSTHACAARAGRA